MSIHEIQSLVFQKGQFTFSDGKQNEGMIISRYNIPQGRVEYYLIPTNNMLAYQAARSTHELDAHKKLGMIVEIGNIMQAKMIN